MKLQKVFSLKPELATNLSGSYSMNIVKVILKSILLCLMAIIEPLWEQNFTQKNNSNKTLTTESADMQKNTLGRLI